MILRVAMFCLSLRRRCVTLVMPNQKSRRQALIRQRRISRIVRADRKATYRPKCDSQDPMQRGLSRLQSQSTMQQHTYGGDERAEHNPFEPGVQPRDVGRAKRAAPEGSQSSSPIAAPLHVLLSVEAYRKLQLSRNPALLDLLAQPDAGDIDSSRCASAAPSRPADLASMYLLDTTSFRQLEGEVGQSDAGYCLGGRITGL